MPILVTILATCAALAIGFGLWLLGERPVTRWVYGSILFCIGLLLLGWHIAYACQPLKEQSVITAPVQSFVSEDGSSKQFVLIDDQMLNVTEQFKVILPTNAVVKKTTYRDTYLGIWSMNDHRNYAYSYEIPK